jgi:hypothetical protein
VRSASYADEPPAAADRDEQDRRNNAKLVRALREHADRRAHYTCVIVLLRHAEDPEPVIAEGTWQGSIIEAPRGRNGFGYDPHFLVPDLGKTAAELEPAEKNLLSHRGKALRRLLAKLKQDPRPNPPPQAGEGVAVQSAPQAGEGVPVQSAPQAGEGVAVQSAPQTGEGAPVGRSSRAGEEASFAPCPSAARRNRPR